MRLPCKEEGSGQFGPKPGDIAEVKRVDRAPPENAEPRCYHDLHQVSAQTTGQRYQTENWESEAKESDGDKKPPVYK